MHNLSSLRQFIGENNCFNSLSYIVYGFSAISLVVIVTAFYLIPSDTTIIPVQTPLEQKIIFLEDCIDENKNSSNLNETTPNQFCTNMYKMRG